jgi:hypothetical protein
MMRRRFFTLLLLALGFALFPANEAQAHLGPPFPILVDQKIPGYAVTVWSNPDVTQGVLFVTLEPDRKQMQPTVSGVDFWIEPVDQHTARKNYHASTESKRGILRFATTPDFDAVGPWKVGTDIHFASGADFSIATQVQATPPGVGPWGLLLFLFPFILFGGLWVLMLIRRSKRKAALKAQSKTPVCRVVPPSENGEPRNRL